MDKSEERMREMKDGCYHQGHFCCTMSTVHQSLGSIKNPKWDFGDEDDDESGFAYEDASVFLDGACNLFSLALNELFGFPSFELLGKDNRLIHCFCITQYKGQTAFVDVRGITTSISEFWGHFLPSPYDTIHVRQQRTSEERACLTDDENCGYEFARWILSNYQEYYQIQGDFTCISKEKG